MYITFLEGLLWKEWKRKFVDITVFSKDLRDGWCNRLKIINTIKINDKCQWTCKAFSLPSRVNFLIEPRNTFYFRGNDLWFFLMHLGSFNMIYFKGRVSLFPRNNSDIFMRQSFLLVIVTPPIRKQGISKPILRKGPKKN